MKNCTIFAVVFCLVSALTAPAGAVFASQDLTNQELATTINSSVEIFKPNDLDLSENTNNDEQITAFDLGSNSESTLSLHRYAVNSNLNSRDIPLIAAPNYLTQIFQDNPAQQIVITELKTRVAGSATSELVELFNASQTDIDITEWCLQRAPKNSQSFSELFCFKASEPGDPLRIVFPAQSYVVLTSSALLEAQKDFVSDGSFKANMADDGGSLRLIDDSRQQVDLIGWGDSAVYLTQPASSIPASGEQSLQRNLINQTYQNQGDNSTDFALKVAKIVYQTGALREQADLCLNLDGFQLTVPDDLIRQNSGNCVPRASINFCDGLKINEIAANASRQFVEIINQSSQPIFTGGCQLATNRSQVITAELPEQTLMPDHFLLIYIDQTNLKLTKSSSGTVYLLASDGETEIDAIYYEDLSSETAWSNFADGWRQTYEMTPGTVNVFMQFAACPAGQERNSETGRCRNLTKVKVLAPCKEGQYRSEETGRCRSLVNLVNSLKPCAEGQFRNPATNRCKKIASTDDVASADCGEGRERNPITKRCRNILAKSIPAADFAITPINQPQSVFIGWFIVATLAIGIVSFAAWQWRSEIIDFLQKIPFKRRK